MKKLITISGPSTAGKSTLLTALKKRNVNLKEVISHTTRKPRKGEVNGIDYYFVTPKQFDKIGFVESVVFSGERYGTSHKELERIVKIPDAIPILIAEPHGVAMFATNLTDVPQFKIFVNIPVQDAITRLTNRMIHTGMSDEDNKKFATRMMSLIKHEMNWDFANEWDFTIPSYNAMNKLAIEEILDAAIRLAVNPQVGRFIVKLK